MSEEKKLAAVVRSHLPQVDDVADIVAAIIEALNRFEAHTPEVAEQAKQAQTVASAALTLKAAIEGASRETWYALQRADKRRRDAAWLPSAEAVLLDVERIHSAASAAAKQMSRRGRPINQRRQGLAIELGLLWYHGTGENVGVSGEQTMDQPRTRFAKFAADILLLRPTTRIVRTGFGEFVKSARAGLVGKMDTKVG